MNARTPTSSRDPIAIVGTACRLPGADSPAELWSMLADGRDGLTEVPPSRWDVDAFYDEDPGAEGKMRSRWGGFVRNVDGFDPLFFGISRREAYKMDPQQRLLLEVVWEAFEDAAIPPARLSASATGVFVGIGGIDYTQVAFESGNRVIDAYLGLGNAHSIAANRLSFLFNLKGPSLAVDTACSSSMVALHLACRSIWSGEASGAIVGATHLTLLPYVSISFSKAGMLSPDGRCKTFDANADGYVRGEGVAALLLKRLADAERDGDRIHGLIRGSALNQDGRTPGITMPARAAQREVIQAALQDAGVRPESVTLIEAHGTGTSLGDRIEVGALSGVYGAPTDDGLPCFLGSIKANIGHLEVTSGLASILKVILSMRHRQAPPQIHVRELNPNLDLDRTRFVVPRRAEAWNPPRGPRIAAISSFGFGGSNAHLILEEPPSKPEADRASRPDRPGHVLALSAKTAPALRALAERYAAFLEGDRGAESLPDLCFTANTGRTSFAHRLAAHAGEAESLRCKLRAFAETGGAPDVHARVVDGTRVPRIAFLFTGQGSQFAGMGRRLYETEPRFREALDRCAALADAALPEPLLSVLYPDEAADPERIDRTGFAQPAIFALEYALATYWRSLGVVPGAVLGHSVGEYAAACAAGLFSLEDAVRLVTARAALMEGLPEGGAMAAVFGDEATVRDTLADFAPTVDVAAINGPKLVTLSGERSALDEAIERLRARGVRAERMRVSHAFHSARMDPILDAYRAVAERVVYQTPLIPFFSTVLGREADPSEIARPEYWVRNVRDAVLFRPAIEALVAGGVDTLVEIGPKPVLVGMGKRCVANPERFAWLPGRAGADGADWPALLDTVAALHALGASVDWSAFDAPYARRRVDAPTYAFQREPFWVVPERKPGSAAGLGEWVSTEIDPIDHPLLSHRVRSAAATLLVEARLSLEALPYLADHVMDGTCIYPASGFVEMTLAAAAHLFGAGNHWIEDLRVRQAVVLTEKAPRVVQVAIEPPTGGAASFRVLGLRRGERASGPADTGAGWVEHASGLLRLDDCADRAVTAPGRDGARTSIDALLAEAPHVEDADAFYAAYAQRGYGYGPAFRGVREIRRGDHVCVGRVALPRRAHKDGRRYRAHPALVDACLQTIAKALPDRSRAEARGGLYLPVGARRVRWFVETIPDEVWVRAVVPPDSEGEETTLEADLRIFDHEGRSVGEIVGVELMRAGGRAAPVGPASERPANPESWTYRVAWVSQDADPARPDATRRDRGRWLILADSGGIGGAMADILGAQNEPYTLVKPARAWRSASDGNRDEVEIDPADASHYARLIERAGDRILGVIDLWPLDVAVDADAAGDAQLEAAARLTTPVLHLVQKLSAAAAGALPRLWIVTRGARAVLDKDDVPAPAHATLWGFGNTLSLERPGLRCTLIDLDPRAMRGHEGLLLQEVWNDGPERQVAFRAMERYVARLRRDRTGTGGDSEGRRLVIPDAESYTLRTARPGRLDRLELRASRRPSLGPGAVEIEVAATGLNFRDVMNAMGLYPGKAIAFGAECSGRVSAVGEGVEGLALGDEVMGIAPASFDRFVVTDARVVSRIPRGIPLQTAAALPVTFLTALYALDRLARLDERERVLVHAGAGGVGLAAIALARLRGARIFATAGSDAKRNHLRALGVEHVMSSRDLSFHDEVLAATGGEGVDVVLNSLPGEFIPKSLALLRSYGRFVEIGRVDIYRDRAIGLAPFRRNLSYFAVDLDLLCRERAPIVRAMLAELVELFEQGALTPPPCTTFPLEDAVGAFRFMSQRKNIGKIVVTHPTPAPSPRAVERRRLRPDARYLITGGLGGLGIELAGRFVAGGARDLVLVGRSGAPGDRAREAIEAMRAAGARVVAVAADVADPEAARGLIESLRADGPALGGVIHAAGVLDDAGIGGGTPDRLRAVMAPKVAGAWNLHRLTRDVPLDFFVCFGSMASVGGSAGQAAYSAANAFVDALASHRRAMGLPATTISWGPWSRLGMAADPGLQERLRGQGVAPIDPEDGLRALERALDRSETHLVVTRVDWRRMGASLGPRRTTPFLSELVEAVDAAATQPSDDVPLARVLGADGASRPERILGEVRARLAAIMALEPAELSVDEPLQRLGLDSLMGMELIDSLEAALGIEIPVEALTEGPTLRALAATLAERIGSDPRLRARSDAEPPDDRGDRAQETRSSFAALGTFAPAERRSAVVQRIRREIARILEADPAEIDCDEPLQTLGLDSLMGMELVDVLEESLRVRFPIERLMAGTTIGDLADLVIEEFARSRT